VNRGSTVFYSVSPEYFGYTHVRLESDSNTMAIGKKGASSGFVRVMRGCVTRLKACGCASEVEGRTWLQ
jgi:hypothetical protein